MRTLLRLKRLLSVAVLLCLSALSWAYDFVADGIYYEINSDGKSVSVAYVSGYVTSSGKVVIPSIAIDDYVSKGYKVTGIGESAFAGCTGLNSISIPNSVTSIGSRAFNNCTGLKSVYISDLESWCKIAFCGSLSNPLYYAHHLILNGVEIMDLVIPNSVTSIGWHTFDGCTGLTSVTIPNSVTSIGYSAFAGCTGLTSVTIPNSVTSIGYSAFAGCTGLTSVTIPNSVTSMSIGVGAFEGCSGLKAVSISDLESWCNIAFSDGASNPLYYAHNLILNGVYIEDLVIPNSVTKIGSFAFYGCTNLNYISIPNSVTSIGIKAFKGCSSLTSITIPNSVTSIEGAAFQNCSHLQTVIVEVEDPLKISKDVFTNYGACLIVPKGSLWKYAEDECWGCFSKITETGTYYIKNVGTGKYLAAGADWGTHAVVNDTGLDFSITRTLLKNDDIRYILDSQVSNWDGNYYLNGSSEDGPWTDGSEFEWDFEFVTEDRFMISYTFENVEEAIVHLYLSVGEDDKVTYVSYKYEDNAWILVPAADRDAVNLATLNAATAENPVDATFLIKGANFNRNDLRNNAWERTKIGGNETVGGPNANRTSYGCEYWNNTFDIHQTIENLPEGVYEFTIAGYGTNGTTYIYANDTEKAFVNTTRAANFGTALDNIANGEYTGNTTGKVTVSKGTPLKIGVKRTSQVGEDWTVFDNACLTYYGPSAEAEITITADNQTMTYGDELPELTYKVTGGELNGRPKLSTTATKTSPVGTYPITVEKGTVTNGNVKFVNGTLTITKAPLTVGVQDESIQEGDDIPAFTLTYDGFRNGDTEATAFTTRPVASTTATKASPVGTYPITVSGGAAGNYALTYTSGTLTITEKPDVTPLITKYIDNPTFEGTTITEGVTTYAKDIQGGQVSGMQPVSGWEFGVENGDAKASGLYEIGGSAFLGGTGYLAPTAGPNGEAEGNLLGMVAVWGATVQYINKTVTLPAGTYTLTVPIYNSKGGTNVPTKSLIGFIADNGTEYLAPAKAYAVNKWTTERVTFTIGEETTGHFSLGYTMTGVGSANAPHYFISSLGLEATTELDAALKVLREEIAVAEALKTEARTEGLAVFNNAINAAKAMLASKDVAAIETAVETLKAAEEAFLTANLPVAEGTYYVYNPQTKKFLSRGASWGTRAVVDDYGVAIRLDVADLPNAAYTLTGFDNNLSYGEDGGMYCDKSGGNVCKYIITNVKGSFTMTETNNGHQVYINEENLTVNHNDAGGTGTYNIWQFLTKEQRDKIVADREAAAKAAAFEKAGITINDELVVGQPTEVSFTTGNNWTETVVRTDKRPVCNEYGTEMWQTTGNYTQTIENLKSGLYTVTIQALYRNGSGIQDVERVSTGYNTVLAYLEANGNKMPVKSWASDKDEENEPSTMETAKAKFDEGKYLSAVYTFVDGDGLLSLKVDNPAYIRDGWLMIGNVKYSKVEKDEFSGLREINVDRENGRIYDLQGRRVNASTLKKGLYIVDGKKMVRK